KDGVVQMGEELAYKRLSRFDNYQGNRATSFSALESEELKTYYYNQTLDHFNYMPDSYTTFPQKYVISFKCWGGANASAPIFVMLGAESPLEVGFSFMTDSAASFNALLVYIEHRYYGESVPFGSKEEAMKNASTKGYFNSAQAIADYAEILIHIKKELHAENSPVIVIGGSYGGALATWFRLKYPHLSLGALASSAPILYFDNITPQNGYHSIVTKNFRETSETCYETILKSWSEIDKVASMPNGLSILSKRFNTCRPLNNSKELKHYLIMKYNYAVQYGAPPEYTVSVICRGIDKASLGSDILSRIYAGIHELKRFKGDEPCLDTTDIGPAFMDEIGLGWEWQICTELVFPMGWGNETMFQPHHFDIEAYSLNCMDKYGVRPRPHWVTTYYGGHDIKLILQRFGSNIIFSNGLKDPFSIGGVLENISDSLVALYTVNGSHCLDLHPATPTDPEWLVNQRKEEVRIIKGWIIKYYDDLVAYKSENKA
ncbi:Lysosomal Pro-X carboxypeptidase, partial [Quillaja saponaria]